MAGVTPPRSTGEETSGTLAEVLEDQAARQQRRDARPEPKDTSRAAKWAVGPLALLTLWFVVAPPAILRPRVPTFTVEAVTTGLRMDIYVVAAQVIGYREANGQLPDNLADALAEPDGAEGMTYTTGPDGTFEIAGQRAGRPIVYRSTESLREFVASARASVMEGTGR